MARAAASREASSVCGRVRTMRSSLWRVARFRVASKGRGKAAGRPCLPCPCRLVCRFVGVGCLGGWKGGSGRQRLFSSSPAHHLNAATERPLRRRPSARAPRATPHATARAVCSAAPEHCWRGALDCCSASMPPGTHLLVATRELTVITRRCGPTAMWPGAAPMGSWRAAGRLCEPKGVCGSGRCSRARHGEGRGAGPWHRAAWRGGGRTSGRTTR
eukprot:scaffold20333_cov64-Phaeocystis_antarctica.AAC.7